MRSRLRELSALANREPAAARPAVHCTVHVHPAAETRLHYEIESSDE